MGADPQRPAVFTVGHSTRTLEEFVRLLKAHSIATVIDVRTVPRSRHVPQFNKETLPASLLREGIAYAHLSGLGGLRHPKKDSANLGWRNASFRGFADYMRSPEFEAGIRKLLAFSKKGGIAIMCAEAVPWRCHRSLISDALLARGIPVLHVISASDARPHALTPFAKVSGTSVTYPPV